MAKPDINVKANGFYRKICHTCEKGSIFQILKVLTIQVDKR